MHPEAERALAIIREIDAEIEINRKKARQIKSECKHYDYDLSYVETMGFDQTPARICVVCRMPGYDLTDDEKRSLFAERCHDYDLEFREDDFQKKKDGFNF